MLTQTGTSFLDFKRQSSTGEFADQFSQYLKSFGDVYFWEKGNFHVVTRADLAREVLTSANFSADRGGFFISRMPQMDLSLIKDFFGVVQKMMVMSDDEDHARKRKIASAGFEDHVLERFAHTVRGTVKALIKEVKTNNQFEFCESIAKKLPSTVLADLFGIPEKDRAQFLEWSTTMTGFFGGASSYLNEDGIKVNLAAKSLKAYFQNLILEREKTPGEDYVSLLLKTKSVFNMSDEDLISQLIMMLVAGQVTTTDQIANIMYLLSTNPDIQKELKANPELIPNALEEMKRLDPAVTFIFRVARAETKIGEQEIKPGDVIFISNHCVNRDLPEEEKPHELRIQRRSSHFAYGYGPHFCLGAKLGRLEMRILFEEILRDLPTLTLDSSKESERDHYSLSFSGFKELHLIMAH